MSKEWFILQYKSNSHNKAKNNLERQGFEIFLPLHETTLLKGSQFKSVTRPLFPGYMFIAFDRTETKWHKINNTYGVSRLVTFNTILKSIPNAFIDKLMTRCDLFGEILPVKKLKKGDQVKVLKGPFENFIAKVEKYDTDQRIWVLMDLMGRKSKIHIERNSLQLSN